MRLKFLSLLTVIIGMAATVGTFSLSASAQSGAGSSSKSETGSGTKSPATSIGQGVAVVELFTSQGCSSCPSADAALRGIANAAEKDGLPVYVLSFHVDYWNRLGWKDPYSDKAFTKRQYQYASASGSSQVYTPQMIVGGTKQFVGSDRTKAVNAVSGALETGSTAKVNLKASPGGSSRDVKVDYAIDGKTQGQELHLAVVQTPEPNQVPRGENVGRTLSHVNVVRQFKTIDLDRSSGSTTLSLPSDFSWQTGKLIAYVQNPRTLAITGASAIEGLTF